MHSQETITKIQGMKELGFSSRQIAKTVLGSESKKTTVNNILKKSNKLKTRKFLSDSFRKASCSPEEATTHALEMVESLKKAGTYLEAPKPKEHDNSRILLISDLHVPYHHQDAFEFLWHLKNKYNPTRVICLGDECENQALSYHEKSPELFSAGYELIEAKKYLKELERMFPEMDILESNHGSLAYRKAKSHGIPKEYLKSYNEILGVSEGWKWHHDMVIELPNGSKLYLHHGKSPNVLKLSQQYAMNAAQGHHHNSFSVSYWHTPEHLLWGMSTGCLIDNDSLSFSYNKLSIVKPVIGTGLVIDSLPVLEPMVLGKDKRWIHRKK